MSTMSIAECFKQLNKFSTPDQELITIFYFLFTHKSYRRQKIIHSMYIYFWYENGNLVKIDYDELLKYLKKNAKMKEALKLLTAAIE